MATDLVVVENQLNALAPRFSQVLPPSITADRLIRTVVISVERLPKLLECDRQSLFNAAMSAACLGLEVDGVTGQAYLIPFKGKAQLVVGYKGMNTLAARSGITIAGAVVRDGDAFEYELGSAPFVRHVPKLGNKGRIIGAWATATAKARPPVVMVMGADDLDAVKKKSHGAQRSDSPWNDPAIGFPAMCEKTVKRRLARSLPLNVMQTAARLDEAVEEQGKHAQVSPERGLIIDGEFTDESEASPTPTADDLLSTSQRPSLTPQPSSAADQPAPSHTRDAASGAGQIPSAADYVAQWNTIVTGATSGPLLASTWNDQKALRKQIVWTDEHSYAALKKKVAEAITFLKQPA